MAIERSTLRLTTAIRIEGPLVPCRFMLSRRTIAMHTSSIQGFVGARLTSRPHSFGALGAMLMLAALGSPLAAQEEGEKKIPPPEDMKLVTKDGMELVCTFFGGTKGKESVPVILLHGYKGNRHDFDSLALYLQGEHGFAVIAPDLRGHGDSTTNKNLDQKLEAEKLRLDQYTAMITNDLETVKSFLTTKNNEGELNIDKLCVVGADMGAAVGTLWAALDWSWPVLATGKQGQDVKAIVMISPEMAFKSLNLAQITSSPDVRSKISIYIAVGAGNRGAVADAKRVYKLFEPFHKAGAADRDLFFDDSMETKLQGTKLLSEESLGLGGRIGQFLEIRAAKQLFPWADRKNPLGGG
jgi:pimeloyl-ACP methyl ester carboxylesterase